MRSEPAPERTWERPAEVIEPDEEAEIFEETTEEIATLAPVHDPDKDEEDELSPVAETPPPPASASTTESSFGRRRRRPGGR